MQIKPITNSQQIIHVIHQAFKRYETDSMPSSALAETSATIEQNIQDGMLILGASLNNSLVGVVKITRYPDSLYFSRLAVLPADQRKGIASKLMAAIENYAHEQQIDHVFCKVRKNETDNIHLYKKLGYAIIKEEITTSPTGFTMETVTMEKKLCTFEL